jgi:NAD(P)-dependent dehydrogenase (short-subunit alcohol dehydrogenase family)
MGELRQGRVVVITGASSGIGRATAHEFARLGCRLVLAARRTQLLRDVAAECRAAGGEALAVTTDVTREADLDALRDAALAAWGRIDVWINNAGTTLFARLDEGDFRLHRRVIETNLLGTMYGARVVLPVFRRQRAGVLINVSSVLGQVGQTFVPSYAISKFGVRGLSEAVRADVHVCTVLPYAVETPHFEAGGNVVGHRAHPMPPSQSPQRVARAIAAVAHRPRRQVYIPRVVPLGLALHAAMPRTTERLLRRALIRFHFGKRQPPTEGNLFAPASDTGPVRGERRPLIGTASFVAWAARQFVVIAAGTLARRLRRAGYSASLPHVRSHATPLRRSPATPRPARAAESR